jgi:hypothetical protein
MKLTKHTIGTTEHRAPRGAYRTFCGKSVELANRRKAYDTCATCTYGARVAELEAEGMTTSDAQAVADAEDMADPTGGRGDNPLLDQQPECAGVEFCRWPVSHGHVR